jgi:hypothetical protein
VVGAALLKGEQLEGALKAAVEQLDARKATFVLATNESWPRRRATSRAFWNGVPKANSDRREP